MTMARSSTEATRLFLWSLPRSCSTAFSKCMTFVDDIDVWMEPYCACHFNETFYNPNFMVGNAHAEDMRRTLARNEASEFMKATREKMKKEIKGNPDVIDQKEISYSWVQQQLEKPTPGKKVIFIKEPSLAIIDHLESLPCNVPCRHSFMIRHPVEMYTSYREMILRRLDQDELGKEPSRIDNVVPFIPMKDLFQIQYRLWKYFQKTSDFEPVIIDAHDILTNARDILPKYFEKVGLPFKERYLQWDASDNSIIKKWKGSADFVLLETKTNVYSRAVNSSRFETPKAQRGTPSNPESRKLTSELKEFVEGALPFYEDMYQNRLQ